MCHARPQNHPCGHSSVKWSYCPAARIDLSTGQETPCRRQTYTTAQANEGTCSLRTCWFGRHARPSSSAWVCCACGQGPNEKGWCTFERQAPCWQQNYMTGEYEVVVDCGHGCCQDCEPYDDGEQGGEESIDEEAEADRRRERSQSVSGKKHSSSGRSKTSKTSKKPSKGKEHSQGHSKKR